MVIDHQEAVSLDQVTAQVLEGAFIAICAEMGDVTIRTGNSSVLVDGRDFSCAILDADEKLVASANFDPSHLSAMAFTTQYAYMELGRDTLGDGDVIIVNDPYRAGGHLPDMCVIRPIFIDRTLVGTAIVRAHHIDVGGMAVGGFAGTAETVFQEGIRIPPVRWYHRGEEQKDVMDLVLLNVRFPEDQLGDFRAQLAATHRAEERINELCKEYGVSVIKAGMKKAQSHSEKLFRAVIDKVPDGDYVFEDFIEDDGTTHSSYRIKVRVTIKGSDVEVDFTGSSAQAPGPINSSFTNTLSATLNAFLQIIGPDVVFNHGCFEPVSVIAPRGSIVNPVAPAPVMGGVAETSLRIIDAISGALAIAGADAVSAAGYGTTQNFTGGGYHSAIGKDVGFYIFLEGGWGATQWRDGWNATPNASSNFQDYPVEVLENRLPVHYLGLSLYTDSGGAGLFRGGLGTERTFKITADNMEFNSLAERHLLQAWGLFGGAPGKPSAIEFQLPGTSEFKTAVELFGSLSPSKFSNVRLPQGTLIRMRQGGGGGYGDAARRDPEAVLKDVLAGYVSVESAEADYRVVLEGNTAESFRLNEAKTEALRRATVDTAEPNYFGVATVNKAHLDAVGRAKPENDQLETVKNSITQIDELHAKLAQLSSQGLLPEEINDPVRSPFATGASKEFWDYRALKLWLSQRGIVFS